MMKKNISSLILKWIIKSFRILLTSSMLGLAVALGKKIHKEEDKPNYKIDSNK